MFMAWTKACCCMIYIVLFEVYTLQIALLIEHALNALFF